MPNYKIHILAGGLLFFALNLYFNFTQLEQVFYGTITVLYSLLPDIDIGNSKLGKSTRIFFVLVAIFFLIQGLLGSILYLYLAGFLLIVLLALLLVKHRKFIHTIRAGLMFSAPLLIWNSQAFAIGVGMYFIHLILDRSFRW